MNPFAAIRPMATRRLTATQRLAARKTLCTSAMRCSSDSKPMPRIKEEPEAQELGVGELQGAKFRIEPLRRVGEDENTKRARLIYQSRKRGTLESDLLLSTFAATYLPTMTGEQMTQFDRFLDENDWDIYYWATQHEPSSSTNPSVATSSASAGAVPADEVTSSSSSSSSEQGVKTKRDPPKGEWAQTVGNFQPAYRPVPQRWRDSEILQLLRDHVRSRSVDGEKGDGMAFMPPLQQ